MLVAISGVGGTGKTTVAKLLARKTKYKLIELNKLAKKINAYVGYDKKRRSKIVSVYRLKKEVKRLHTQQKNMIIEGPYAHEFKADVVVVLRCEPKKLERRLKRKYRWPTKIVENVEAEMIGLLTQEALDYNKAVFEIDTTKRTAEQTAACLEEILKGKGKGGKYRAGRIDWLKG